MAKGRYWTDEEDHSLRRMWTAGDAVSAMARVLNRGDRAIESRMKSLRLPVRRRVSAEDRKIAGQRGRAKLLEIVETYIEPTPNRDDEHVAAVLAEGGFKVLNVAPFRSKPSTTRQNDCGSLWITPFERIADGVD